ncbi:Eco57I restriction-modification methylase domain-containing protein [Limosilactobacillus fermentum]|uniref:Type II methyltransferase M.TaqI-like domain-containing protein n=1 Tax=Limosilactobacillus fermentum TaxID=1613 RepID=A0A2K2TFG6_LIMFE|nr:Eco57I restriction-modification methylase domain-containing protein [Limosilactobacillus fermentum]PNV56931.1 hypothetical protein C1Y38_11225 [Limosilactobacillus fermentum]SPE16940.1 Eco57I restriction-modification methylase [Limosilactobacillus fermentum]
MANKKFKFDVVIGNPPYQEEKAGTGRQAKPIYNLFVQQVKQMGTSIISMITPSRWFAGGIGLNKFRDDMMNDSHMKTIVDYPNAKDVFPNTSISGGVNYFVWERDYDGECDFNSVIHGRKSSMTRKLSEFPVLVRYNESVKIIRKIQKLNEDTLEQIVSAISPYGLSTSVRGIAKQDGQHPIKLNSSKGESYISSDIVKKGLDTINTYRAMVSQTSAEHAGEPSSDGKFKVLTKSMKVMEPGEVCTHSYIFIGPFNTEVESSNVIDYLKTKFVRFLLLQALTSIHISKSTFVFVPMQDFTQTWNDSSLYKKYGLNEQEQAYIDSFIKEMD